MKLMHHPFRLKHVVFDDEDLVLPAQSPGAWQLFTCWRQKKGSPSTKRIHRYITILRNLLVYSLAFWGFFSIIQNLPGEYRARFGTVPTQDHRINGCVCGETIEEATSLGCKFDSLSMAWLPDHCRDDELTAEFETTGKGKTSASRSAQTSILIMPFRSKWDLDIL
jgi:hypothetical protein